MKLSILKSSIYLIIAIFSITVLASALAGPAQQSVPVTLPNGIAAGDVTQTSVVLWTRSTEMGTVNFELATDADFSTIVGEAQARVSDALQPVKVFFNDLQPATQYHYRVTDAAESTMTGTFRTPARIGENAGLRFGVTGDWRGELSPYPAITNAAERDLDFFVLEGDTIYSDYPSPALDKPQATTLEDYRIKHSEVYGTRDGLNAFAPLRSSTAIFAVIDDHEVTNDFSGAAPPSSDDRFAKYEGDYINDTALYRNGLQAFLDYNPLGDDFFTDTGDPSVDLKPRLYRYRTFGSDAAIFILDARSFRSEQLSPVTDITDQSQVIDFLNASLDESRTMLGKPQLADLKADLLDAQALGVTWKFVMIPEPIQNFGTLAAQDRFEGYAAERAELLQFIVDNDVSNVVFVAADFHGTVVNDVTYQGSLRDLLTGTHHRTGTFEVVTGSVAFSEPFGPTVVKLAFGAELLAQEQYDTYFSSSRDGQEEFMTALINGQIEPLGYSLVGLDDAPDIDAELVQGKYIATNVFGWTEFEIDADTQTLRVTTYGIPAYTQDDLTNNLDDVLARTPEVVSEFIVLPQ